MLVYTLEPKVCMCVSFYLRVHACINQEALWKMSRRIIFFFPSGFFFDPSEAGI